MTKILLTGFTPFDDRSVNASWVAVKSINSADIQTVQIPVVWGQPYVVLSEAIERFQPEVIVSLGEGHIGEFSIETIARNKRKHRVDNLKKFPQGLIRENGDDRVSASIPAKLLQSLILDRSENQIPIKISEDAGAFICEETLYTLESFRQTIPRIKTVAFVHIPPYRSKLYYMGKEQKCDEDLLLNFLNRLLDGVLSIHQNRDI